MQIPTPRGFLVVPFLLFLFLSFYILPASANQNGKQKITLTGKNISVDLVLKQIEKQTGMRFMYAVDALDINQKVNVDFHQTFLDEVLSSLFKDKGIVWQYRKGIISLKSQSSNTIPGTIYSPRISSGPINGRIMDSNGEPIPGVTILIKGTMQGTKTDVEGRFSLSNVNKGDKLLISSVGFEKLEYTVSGNDEINISMTPSTGILDEAVVIAYGTATRRDMVGNVTKITADQIAKTPVANPLLALQGRVAGLFINQNTGLAGGGVTTLVQGQNSLTQGNDPFYVIDGVPYTSQLLPNLGGVLGTSGINIANPGNPMSFINPSDIESITVLKDADATAIYGSRAANGAILITTKKGKVGEMSVDFSIQQGWSAMSRRINMLNSKQYMEMRREAIKNDGLDVTDYDYDINGFWDTTRSTNWQKELLSSNATYTTVNTSISGGSNNIQYLVGGTYHKENTLFSGSLSDRKGGLHLSLQGVSPNQKFNIQITTNFILDNNQLPNFDLTSQAISLPPTAPKLYNDDGSLNWMPDASGATTFFNPLSYLKATYSNKTSNLITNLMLKYNILNGLTLSSSFGYNSLQSNDMILTPFSSIAPDMRPYNNRSASFGDGKINSWIIEPQLNYNLKVKNHKIDALLGSSIQQNNSNSRIIYGSGYISDDVISDILQASRVGVIGSTQSTYKYNAIFGRLSYNFSGKYILNLTARRDGSSRFGAANRFHNFGSIGAGWIFSEENFMRKTLPWISFGKLRASYGTTGNDQIGDYSFLNQYLPVTVDLPYRGTVSIAPLGIYNPYLQWEETKKFNVGFDLGIFKDRVLINVNRNINQSSNLLRAQTLAWTAGFNSVLLNFPGTVRNTGWEITINSTNIKGKDFSWSTSINLTIPQNRLVKYPGLENSADASTYFIGHSLATKKAYHYLGIDSTSGRYLFADSKGNSTIKPNRRTDMNVLIDLTPQYYGGIQNTFTYRQFEFGFLFQVTKRNGQNNTSGYPLPGIRYSNQPIEILNRWRKPGDKSEYEKFNSNGSLNSSFNNANASDRSFKDASYIRLKNVSLSWQMPERLRSKLHLKTTQFFIQGQNLLTITNYVGLDPENPGGLGLPPLKTLVLGAHLTL